MAKLGESDYRAGARERLEEASILLLRERFGGAVYLAGRAAEGMLRGVIWKSDPEYRTGRKTLDTGHNLRELLDLVRKLGIRHENPLGDDIAAEVQRLARLWWNDMRFLSEKRISTRWFELKEIGGRRTLKQAARDFYDAASVVIRRCELLWKRN